MVRAPRSGILAIKIDAEGRAKEISHFELLEDIRVDENAKRVPLPDNWQQLSAEAIKTYNQYFIRINKSRAGDKATAAKENVSEDQQYLWFVTSFKKFAKKCS